MTAKVTISEAAYVNADGTAAVIRTRERGAVAISQADRPELWRQMLIWVKAGGPIEPYVPPPQEPRPPKSPEQRLRLFLANNPDVADMLIARGIARADLGLEPAAPAPTKLTRLRRH